MKHIFENAIANVNAAYPSIYTKDDVIQLIKRISAEVEKVPAMDLEALEQIKENLLKSVGRIAFEECIELELSYDNRIEINVNDRAIIDEIRDSFDEAIEDVYPSEKNS